MSDEARRAALAEIEALLADGGDADDVLRAVVARLAALESISWVGLSFVEEGSLVLGPATGDAAGAEIAEFPVRYEGEPVGALQVAGALEDDDSIFFAHVAELIAPHTLLGWDTGGETWTP